MNAATIGYMIDPELEKRFAIFDGLFSEHKPRSLVLLVTAGVSNALEDLLRSEFTRRAGRSTLGVSRHIDSLLTKQPLPPLGSLAVRTKLALVLGLISNEMQTAIDALRKMRNDAAHLAAAFKLESYDLSPLLPMLLKKSRAALKGYEEACESAPPEAIAAIDNLIGNREQQIVTSAAMDIMGRLRWVSFFPDKAMEVMAVDDLWPMYDQAKAAEKLPSKPPPPAAHP